MRPSDPLLDTIVALSTPMGRSALGVVRLCGKQAARILSALAPGLPSPPPARSPLLAAFVDGAGEPIDTGLATWFPAASSPVGEDLVELSLHGSPAAIQRLIETAVTRGARPARRGEFTERAFRAGKLDLVRAEAVRDLIEARTPEAARQSARRLSGSLSERLAGVRDDLLSVSAALSASIDFSDDVGEAIGPEVHARLGAAASALERLSSTAERGRLLSEGCRVAILGRPNAGKSTLFNAVVGSSRAIVTEVPGTTRDSIEATIDLSGVPVTLVDTAGLRETADLVESLGVERAREEAGRADAVLYVFDASEGFLAEDAEALAGLDGRPRLRLTVANKADRLEKGSSRVFEDAVLLCGLSPEAGETLRQLLSARICGDLPSDGASEVLGTLRQRDLVARCREAVSAAEAALSAGGSPEYVVTHCHEALDALSDLVGETTPEDVLERLFATFCVGK